MMQSNRLGTAVLFLTKFQADRLGAGACNHLDLQLKELLAVSI
jgi:hypothetical protein